jgi:hypothetical protein
MIQLEVDQAATVVVCENAPATSADLGHDKAVISCFMHKREARIKMCIGWVIGAARGDCEAAHPRQKGGEATAQETHAT